MSDAAFLPHDPRAARDVLVVIDVQGEPRLSLALPDGTPVPPGHPDAAAGQRRALGLWWRTLGAVATLVAEARRTGAVVLLVEDAMVAHPTHPAVWHALGCSPAVVVRKCLPDGSGVALDALQALGVAPGLVTCCGALTGLCVAETVRGLRAALGRERVRVAPGACFEEEWDEQAHGGES